MNNYSETPQGKPPINNYVTPNSQKYVTKGQNVDFSLGKQQTIESKFLNDIHINSQSDQSIVQVKETNFDLNEFKKLLIGNNRIIILKKILEIYIICQETQIHKTAENLMLNLGKEHFPDIFQQNVDQTIKTIDKLGEIINKGDMTNMFETPHMDLNYIKEQYPNIKKICIQEECLNSKSNFKQPYLCKDNRHDKYNLEEINVLLQQFNTIKIDECTRVEIYRNSKIIQYLKQNQNFSDKGEIQNRCQEFPHLIKIVLQIRKQNEELSDKILNQSQKLIVPKEPIETNKQPFQKNSQIVTICSHENQKEFKICIQQDCKFETTTVCQNCEYQHKDHRTISIQELAQFQFDQQKNIDKFIETKKIFKEHQYFDDLIRIYSILNSENLNLEDVQCVEKLGTILRENQIYPLSYNQNSIFQCSSELLTKFKYDEKERLTNEFQTQKCQEHKDMNITKICLDQQCINPLMCDQCGQQHIEHKQRCSIREVFKKIFEQKKQIPQILTKESQNFKKITNQMMIFHKDLRAYNYLKQFCKQTNNDKDWKKFAEKYREYYQVEINSSEQNSKYQDLFKSQFAFQETFLNFLVRLDKQEKYKVDNKNLKLDGFTCDKCEGAATEIELKTGKILCKDHKDQSKQYETIVKYLIQVNEKETQFNFNISNWEKLIQKYFKNQMEFMKQMYLILFQTTPWNFNEQENQQQISMNTKLMQYRQQIQIKQNNLKFMDNYVEELYVFQENSFQQSKYQYHTICDRKKIENIILDKCECGKVSFINLSQSISFKLIGILMGNIQTQEGGYIFISLIIGGNNKTKKIHPSFFKATNNTLNYIQFSQEEQVLVQMNQQVEIVFYVNQETHVQSFQKKNNDLLIDTIQDIQVTLHSGIHGHQTIIGDQNNGLIQSLLLLPIQ